MDRWAGCASPPVHPSGPLWLTLSWQLNELFTSFQLVEKRDRINVKADGHIERGNVLAKVVGIAS